MQLSVIIPAWNEAESLETSIERITAALGATRLEAEIIVCDNASTDE